MGDCHAQMDFTASPETTRGGSGDAIEENLDRTLYMVRAIKDLEKLYDEGADRWPNHR